MRCVEVTRELSAPTGAIDPAELSRHLAGCPRCAAWSARAERFDRIWEATRSAEPSAAAWEDLWAAVDRAAAVPEPSGTIRAWPRRRLIVAAVALAQAAAILLAVVAFWPRHAARDDARHVQNIDSDPPRYHRLQPVSASAVDVEQGSLMIIRIGENGIRQVEPLEMAEPLTTAVTVSEVAPDVGILNYMESLQ